jgi:aerobic carbon-monoxide dehydrogenase small subunit
VSVNGQRREADQVWAGESLLYLLRERLGLPGAKNACEQGECGSCTVYLDGQPVCSCLVAAGQAQGRSVVTVEGLAVAEAEQGIAVAEAEQGMTAAEAIQHAFIEAGAVQCGFCTPGLIVAVHDLLARTASGRGSGAGDNTVAEPDIREALAGNLCRCTGYEKIIEAVRLAAR